MKLFFLLFVQSIFGLVTVVSHDFSICDSITTPATPIAFNKVYVEIGFFTESGPADVKHNLDVVGSIRSEISYEFDDDKDDPISADQGFDVDDIETTAIFVGYQHMPLFAAMINLFDDNWALFRRIRFVGVENSSIFEVQDSQLSTRKCFFAGNSSAFRLLDRDSTLDVLWCVFEPRYYMSQVIYVVDGLSLALKSSVFSFIDYQNDYGIALCIEPTSTTVHSIKSVKINDCDFLNCSAREGVLYLQNVNEIEIKNSLFDYHGLNESGTALFIKGPRPISSFSIVMDEVYFKNYLHVIYVLNFPFLDFLASGSLTKVYSKPLFPGSFLFYDDTTYTENSVEGSIILGEISSGFSNVYDGLHHFGFEDNAYYVDMAGSAGGDGSSFAKAQRSLCAALSSTAAAATDGGFQRVYMVGGMYTELAPAAAAIAHDFEVFGSVRTTTPTSSTPASFITDRYAGDSTYDVDDIETVVNFYAGVGGAMLGTYMVTLVNNSAACVRRIRFIGTENTQAGLFRVDNAHFTARVCYFAGNATAFRLCSESATLAVVWCVFRPSNANYIKRAIFVEHAYSVRIESSFFDYIGDEESNGGVLCVNPTDSVYSVTVCNSDFSLCAGFNGSALYATGVEMVGVVNCSFAHGYCANVGPAFYILGPAPPTLSLTIQSVYLFNNTAAVAENNGTDIYVQGFDLALFLADDVVDVRNIFSDKYNLYSFFGINGNATHNMTGVNRLDSLVEFTNLTDGVSTLADHKDYDLISLYYIPDSGDNNNNSSNNSGDGDNSDNSDNSEPSVPRGSGAVGGGVGGGIGLLVLFVVIVVIACCCCRRRNKQADQHRKMDEANVVPLVTSLGE